jgi:hypothetical protein
MKDNLPLKCVTFPTMPMKRLDGMIIESFRCREKWGMYK